MLTQQLRELEDDGIIHRKIHLVVPPEVEYSLTAYGRTPRPITDLMCKWGETRLRRLKGSGMTQPPQDGLTGGSVLTRPSALRGAGMRLAQRPTPRAQIRA
jgi:hypothetical protein